MAKLPKERKFICDGCGEEVFDTPHASYDENFGRHRGIKLCSPCRFGEDSLEEE